MESNSGKINIIKLVTEFGIAPEKREDFLFSFRQFLNNVKDAEDASIKLQLKTIVKTEFEPFGGNQELIVNTISEFSRSILKAGKNKTFVNLLVSLISNYLNALKFDPDKHIMLYYPNNEFWDNINAEEITDISTIDSVCKIYVDAKDNELDSTTVVFKATAVPVENLKIKTRNNYEKSVLMQKVADYKNMVIGECDARELKGSARTTYISEKVRNYKAKLYKED